MVKALIKHLAAFCGFQITRCPRYARALDRPSNDNAFHEQRRLLRSVRAPVIFDVGAHFGETAAEYCKLFPSARIFSFEPFPSSFAKLCESINGNTRICAEKLALGGPTRSASLKVNRSSATNSLLGTDPRASDVWGAGLVDTINETQVEVVTLDEFMREHPLLQRIDILKLDVQGSEVDVLRGATRTLGAGKIGLIYSEVILAPTYAQQGTFEELLRLTREAGFSLHNLYNPLYSRGKLAQMDALFIHDRHFPADASN